MVIFQGLVALALLHQLAELQKMAGRTGLLLEDSLAIGTPAPDFDEIDFRSTRPISSRNIDERGAVLLFVSSCSTCVQLAEDLAKVTAHDLPPIMAFCQGGDEACGTIVDRLAPEIPLVIKNSEKIAQRYRVSGSPTAVVLNSERLVRGHGHPGTLKELRQLVAKSLGEGSTETRAADELYSSASG